MKKEQEVTILGYKDVKGLTNEQRQKQPTDYAKAQGIWNNNCKGYYLLSSVNSFKYPNYVGNDGSVCNYNNIYNCNGGVVPALLLIDNQGSTRTSVQGEQNSFSNFEYGQQIKIEDITFPQTLAEAKMAKAALVALSKGDATLVDNILINAGEKTFIPAYATRIKFEYEGTEETVALSRCNPYYQNYKFSDGSYIEKDKLGVFNDEMVVWTLLKSGKITYAQAESLLTSKIPFYSEANPKNSKVISYKDSCLRGYVEGVKTEGFPFDPKNTGSLIQALMGIREKNPFKVKTYTLPEGTKEVPPYAAYGASDLNKIVLPETTETIGEGAFTYCPNVEEIQIGNKKFNRSEGHTFVGATINEEGKLMIIEKNSTGEEKETVLSIQDPKDYYLFGGSYKGEKRPKWSINLKKR